MITSSIVYQYDAEKNIDRATSVFDFLLQPELLTKHLAAIQDGSASNPTGMEMIKLFYKQCISIVNKPSSVAQAAPLVAAGSMGLNRPGLTTEARDRVHLLRKLSAQVMVTLQYGLEEIENQLPIEFQRQLLLDACNFSPDTSETFTVTYHRWIVRSVTRRPRLLRSEDPDAMDKEVNPFSTDVNDTEHAITQKTVQDSAERLHRYISQPHKDDTSAASIVRAACDLGEYLFVAHDLPTPQSSVAFIPFSLPTLSVDASTAFDIALKGHVILPAPQRENIDVEKVKAYLTALGADSPSNRGEVKERVKHLTSGNVGQICETLMADLEIRFCGMSEALSHSMRWRPLTDGKLDEISRERVYICNVIYDVLSRPNHLRLPRCLSDPSYAEQNPEILRFFLQQCRQVVSLGGMTEDNANKIRAYIESLYPSLGKAFSGFSQEFPQLLINLPSTMRQENNGNDKRGGTELKIQNKYRKIWSTTLQDLPASPSFRELNPARQASVLVERAHVLCKEGCYEESKNVLRKLTEISVPPALVSSVKFMENKIEFSEENSNKKDVCDHLIETMSQYGLPQDRTFLESLTGDIITWGKPEQIAQFCATFQKQVEKAKESNERRDEQQTAYQHKILGITQTLSQLQNHLTEYHRIGKSPANPDEVNPLWKGIDVSFDNLVGHLVPLTATSYSKNLHSVNIPNIEWNCKRGILSYMGNRDNCSLVENLASLFTAGIQVIRKARKGALNEYYAERMGDLFSQFYNGSAAGNRRFRFLLENNEAMIYELLRHTLQRLIHLQPANSKWHYALGDSYLDLDDFNISGGHSHHKDTWKQRHSISSYLTGLSLDVGFCDSTTTVTRDFNLVVKRLSASLVAVREFVPAMVFYQFLGPVDYTRLFSIVQDHFSLLDPTWFPYIWEVPVLESLIAIYAKTRDEKKLSLLNHLISNAALNQHNSPETRENYVNQQKSNFLKVFTRKFNE
ncbi:hypothetical protein PROFUN_13658 [Planoprotostelium fungivorum]|uniref:INTS8 TPR repeats domain-containing protein n=1 Tax=Planoprotostelium fungivorum TaxID=1890364 RepID=A0A2P6N3F4_9EUKA|nr:hypothetical protein PROFUN_13658 [Planoprotostelium fungivorum]